MGFTKTTRFCFLQHAMWHEVMTTATHSERSIGSCLMLTAYVAFCALFSLRRCAIKLPVSEEQFQSKLDLA
jgi:hypothetical protein